MGEMADYYMWQGFEAELSGEYDYDSVPSVKDRMWKDKQGKLHRISKMEDSHLVNTEAYMRRTRITHLPQYARILKQIATRKLTVKS